MGTIKIQTEKPFDEDWGLGMSKKLRDIVMDWSIRVSRGEITGFVGDKPITDDHRFIANLFSHDPTR